MKAKTLMRPLAYLLILLGLGVLAAAAGYPIYNPTVPLNWRLVLSLFLLADAACYFTAAWEVLKGIKWLSLPTMALLTINALAVIFDDIGLPDIIFLALNTSALALLIYSKKK